ncbi:probable trehalose-phosphate phosphatase H isoform X1 [Musa acuminata AAA Group]|uniref:probable trehalose-phosphate phosphatase H isoform X1 n=2 Tax=Musa acuminata AAA Group TaxID=214697 RepID=UPI0031D59372
MIPYKHAQVSYSSHGCVHSTKQMGLERLRAQEIETNSTEKEVIDENEERIAKMSSRDCRCDEPTRELQSNEDEVESSAEEAYAAWMVKHPSALIAFDRMMSIAKEKMVVVFLDYDGTLSPIVDDPDRAFMSDSMRSAVNKVAQYFPTCIISGRRRDKVYEFVKLTNVYYVGSHGMDIMAPLKPVDEIDSTLHEQAIKEKGNEGVLFQPAEEYLPMIEEVYSELKEKTKEIQGVLIENNKFCISVHFRRVDEEDWSLLENQVMDTMKNYPALLITRGRKVIEIRPSIKWDKGRALEYLLETLGFGNNDKTLPLYIGDDRTDEDAFKILQRRGQGYPIIVSSVPKDTEASYSLRDPSEVMSFLLHLFRWKKDSS